MSDLNSHRIAAALERIAVALEKANEGIVLTAVEERVSPAIRSFAETDLEGNVRTTRVDAENFILCSATGCNNRATIAPRTLRGPSYADRNDGLCDSCREVKRQRQLIEEDYR